MNLLNPLFELFVCCAERPLSSGLRAGAAGSPVAANSSIPTPPLHTRRHGEGVEVDMSIDADMTGPHIAPQNINIHLASSTYHHYMSTLTLQPVMALHMSDTLADVCRNIYLTIQTVMSDNAELYSFFTPQVVQRWMSCILCSPRPAIRALSASGLHILAERMFLAHQQVKLHQLIHCVGIALLPLNNAFKYVCNPLFALLLTNFTSLCSIPSSGIILSAAAFTCPMSDDLLNGRDCLFRLCQILLGAPSESLSDHQSDQSLVGLITLITHLTYAILLHSHPVHSQISFKAYQTGQTQPPIPLRHRHHLSAIFMQPQPVFVNLSLISALYHTLLFNTRIVRHPADLAVVSDPPTCKLSLTRAFAFELFAVIAAISTRTRRTVMTLCEMTHDNDNGLVTVTAERSEAAAQIGWNYAPQAQTKTAPYVGLHNQGATCYMNSLIQQLYMIPPFRYTILTQTMTDKLNSEECIESLLYQLQYMFAYLQESSHRYYDAVSILCCLS